MRDGEMARETDERGDKERKKRGETEKKGRTLSRRCRAMERVVDRVAVAEVKSG